MRHKLPAGWQPMATAPTNGTLINLLVWYRTTGKPRANMYYATIGCNVFAHGKGVFGQGKKPIWAWPTWDFNQDYFAGPKTPIGLQIGTPIGWAPKPPAIVDPTFWVPRRTRKPRK